MIPGFFQTPGYARAAIAGTAPGLHLAEVERRMQARLARQKALFEDRDQPPTIHVLLDESVIRRQVGGPQAMREQLARLAEIAQRPNVTIQVLPFSCTTDPGINGWFTRLEIGRPAIFGTVLIEHLTGRLTLEDEADLARYREAAQALWDEQLAPVGAGGRAGRATGPGGRGAAPGRRLAARARVALRHALRPLAGAARARECNP